MHVSAVLHAHAHSSVKGPLFIRANGAPKALANASASFQLVDILCLLMTRPGSSVVVGWHRASSGKCSFHTHYIRSGSWGSFRQKFVIQVCTFLSTLFLLWAGYSRNSSQRNVCQAGTIIRSTRLKQHASILLQRDQRVVQFRSGA